MKARTYKKLLRLNQDEQERLRYLSKSTGLNQEQVLRKVLMDAPLLERPTADYIKMSRQIAALGNNLNQLAHITNDTAYAMLANSEFVVMLRQTKDIDSVVELYGLSEPQRKYLLLAQPGEGIIKMGNSLIPFNNPQPKDTKTYKLLTTKPGEME